MEQPAPFIRAFIPPLTSGLLDQIDSKHGLTKDNVKHIVNELARITLSYRPTYFFQAAYAETASSKALFAAIKNPKLNELIPIAELLLGENVDPSKESNDEIVQRLRGLQVSNKWEKSSLEINTLGAM